MKTLQNVNLAEKTTFRVGGITRNYYIPESVEELTDVICELKDSDYRLISGGSNLLINDKKTFENVISCELFDKQLNFLGDGHFYVGASNKIQEVISSVNEYGYGGFEELIGLPALFGGIIYMNAGIGGRKKVKFNIGDFIERVKCLDRATKNILWIDKNGCEFGYRSSIFKQDKYIILGAEIKLEEQNPETSKLKIQKRKDYCRDNQEWGKGCFGSCFCRYTFRILKMNALISKLFSTRIHLANNNPNWLVNNGNATFKSAMRIINTANLLHKLFHKEIEAEVIIWK